MILSGDLPPASSDFLSGVLAFLKGLGPAWAAPNPRIEGWLDIPKAGLQPALALDPWLSAEKLSNNQGLACLCLHLLYIRI